MARRKTTDEPIETTHDVEPTRRTRTPTVYTVQQKILFDDRPCWATLDETFTSQADAENAIADMDVGEYQVIVIKSHGEVRSETIKKFFC